MLNEIQKFVFVLIDSNNLIPFYFGYAHTINKLAKLIKVKIQIIRENNIIECLLITCKLLFVTMRIASVKIIVGNIFGFNIEYRHSVFPTCDIVRCTALLPLRLIDNTEFRKKCLHQLL